MLESQGTETGTENAIDGALGFTGRVFIIDDHPVFRMGLSALIESQSDLAVCGEAAAMVDDLDVITATKPHLVVVDITLQENNGLDLITRMRSQLPDLAVLVISMHDEHLYAQRVIKAGAKGFLMKGEKASVILGGIRNAIRGELVLSENQQALLLNQMVKNGGSHKATLPVEALSNRELHVFELLGQGKRTRDIADHLGLSVKTIETHQANIKRKLTLRDYTDLVRAATGWMNKINLAQ